MKKKILLLIATVILAGTLGACGDTRTVVLTENKNSGDVNIDYSIDSYDSVNIFGYHLFHENMQEVSNPVISPVSAYLALAMAGNGAAGVTREEFDSLLGKDGKMTALSDDMMNRFPQDKGKFKLMLANSAWLDDEFTVNKEWLDTISSLFDAQAYQAELSSTDAMNSMNHWVEVNTQGLIPQMIEEPLPADARLVLFNTLYLKGKWSIPFMKEATYDESFTLADGTVVQTEMMHQREEYYDYLINDYAEGVIMPYQDSNLAFVALKPEGNMSVRDIFEKLTPDEVQRLLNEKQESTLINLTIPKFEVTCNAILNDSLKNLGLQTAFDEEKADLSGLGSAKGGGNLYISLVRQKAVVRVDEEGTEAAAATEVAIAEGCALLEKESVEITFDKPFLYMIMDMDMKVPLFIGIMDNPTL